MYSLPPHQAPSPEQLTKGQCSFMYSAGKDFHHLVSFLASSAVSKIALACLLYCLCQSDFMPDWMYIDKLIAR